MRVASARLSEARADCVEGVVSTGPELMFVDGAEAMEREKEWMLWASRRSFMACDIAAARWSWVGGGDEAYRGKRAMRDCRVCAYARVCSTNASSWLRVVRVTLSGSRRAGLLGRERVGRHCDWKGVVCVISTLSRAVLWLLNEALRASR